MSFQDIIDRTEGRSPSFCCSGKCNGWKKMTPAQKSQFDFLKVLAQKEKEREKRLSSFSFIGKVSSPNEEIIELSPTNNSFRLRSIFSYTLLCSMVGIFLTSLGTISLPVIFFGGFLGGLVGFFISRKV